MARAALLPPLVASAVLAGPTTPPPTVPGTTTTTDAPVLALGISQDHVPAGRLRTFHRLRRPPGATSYVAATITGRGTGTATETDTLRVLTPQGLPCGESSGTWDRNDPLLLLGVAVDAARGLREGSDDTCRSAPELVVVLDRTAGPMPASAALDMTYRVVQEPGVVTLAGLPAAVPDNPPAEADATAGQARPTRWTDDLGEPVTLTPATWSASLPLNRTVYYRVRLDYGQRAAITVRPTTSGGVRLSTWARSPVGLDVPQPTGAEGSVAPTVSLPEVRYLNRAGGRDVAGASVPGYYTVAVRTVPVSTDPTTWPPSVPVTLAVAVRGTEHGAPRYLTAPTGGPVTATPEPSIYAASPIVAAPTASSSTTTLAPRLSSTEGTSPWAWAGCGLGVLLGAAGLWLLRRRDAS